MRRAGRGPWQARPRCREPVQCQPVTQPGARSCPLPDDFGRLLHTRDEVTPGLPGPGSSGLFVRGSTTDRPLPLQYRETLAFRQLRTLTHSRPQYFTFAQEGGQRTLVLDPPPDTNAGTNYTGEGVYIARVERPDLEDQVLLDEPTVIVAGVLAQIAGDRGLTQAQSLTAEYRMLLSAMVNNQARQRTKMYSQRWPVNRAYTR